MVHKVQVSTSNDQWCTKVTPAALKEDRAPVCVCDEIVCARVFNHINGLGRSLCA
jgi:hypothetical protein